MSGGAVWFARASGAPELSLRDFICLFLISPNAEEPLLFANLLEEKFDLAALALRVHLCGLRRTDALLRETLLVEEPLERLHGSLEPFAFGLEVLGHSSLARPYAEARGGFAESLLALLDPAHRFAQSVFASRQETLLFVELTLAEREQSRKARTTGGSQLFPLGVHEPEQNRERLLRLRLFVCSLTEERLE